MIEHISLAVKNFKKMKEFYTAALKPIGYKIQYEFPGAVGYKEGGHTSFWVVKSRKIIPTHVAFQAKSRKTVHNFHQTALRAGGKDNGGPGLRKEYSSDYYAAFVLDPEGNNIEAVCYK
jgi:catechol 2,3-dioxygenase-like lactoylglutathione lyase family enzyme